MGCFLFCFDFGFLLSHVSVLFPVCPVVVVTFARVSFSLCLSAPVSPLVLKTFCCVLCGLYYQLLSTVVLRDQMYCSLRKHQQIEKGCRRTKHSGSWIRHKNVSKAHKNKWIQKEKFTKNVTFCAFVFFCCIYFTFVVFCFVSINLYCILFSFHCVFLLLQHFSVAWCFFNLQYVWPLRTTVPKCTPAFGHFNLIVIFIHNTDFNRVNCKIEFCSLLTTCFWGGWILNT